MDDILATEESTKFNWSANNKLIKGRFQDPTNHADERQQPKKIDWCHPFNWLANNVVWFVH